MPEAVQAAIDKARFAGFRWESRRQWCEHIANQDAADGVGLDLATQGTVEDATIGMMK